MNTAVFGTGMVGQTIAAKLAALGHRVAVGTRDVAATLARAGSPDAWNPAFADWQRQHPDVKLATYAEAAASGEIIFNATNGAGTLPALEMAGAGNLNGKILIDISNPLDFSKGMPPSLTVCNTDSLGEQIQRAFPDVRVVKTLNTVTASLMVNPRQLADGDHHIFVSGNDAAAKAQATAILKDWFGWREVIDLGDITTARGVEMYLPLWLRLWGFTQSPNFNVKIVR
ncbi:MAG: NAD(P)-binding domain-containing protein [Anaerolineae bacterium]|nr:NAD(P)-binding domain-containing protein [Anaerolineae bacterium]